MEWIETVGRTEAEAKGLALDRLGIAEDDLEYQVLEESKRGILRRAEVRIRARVRPVSHEPQRNRRRRQRGAADSSGESAGQGRRDEGRGDRSGRRSNSGSGGRNRNGRGRNDASTPASDARTGARSGDSKAATRTDTSPGTTDRPAATTSVAEEVSFSRPNTDSSGNDSGRSKRRSSEKETKAQKEPMETSQQATMIEDFIDDLLDAFELEANVSSVVDGENLNILIDGEGLGVLIGPDAVTNRAIQEICRTILHRKGGSDPLRVNVDVAGYRDARREALAEFTRRTAAAVLETGMPHRLDWMNSSDRKVVHDVVNDIDGVSTISEGQEPRRNVVLVRDGGKAAEPISAYDEDDDDEIGQDEEE